MCTLLFSHHILYSNVLYSLFQSTLFLIPMYSLKVQTGIEYTGIKNKVHTGIKNKGTNWNREYS